MRALDVRKTMPEVVSAAIHAVEQFAQRKGWSRVRCEVVISLAQVGPAASEDDQLAGCAVFVVQLPSGVVTNIME